MQEIDDERLKLLHAVGTTQTELWEYVSALEDDEHRQRLRELLCAALDAINSVCDYYEMKVNQWTTS